MAVCEQQRAIRAWRERGWRRLSRLFDRRSIRLFDRRSGTGQLQKLDLAESHACSARPALQADRAARELFDVPV